LVEKRDLQLGKIALRAGMVTKEQLAKSLAIQKKLDKPVGLGAIFLKKGYISKEQLEEIVKKHNDEKDKNGTAAADASGEAPKKEKKKKKKKKKGAEGSEAQTASEAPSDAKVDESAEKKDEKKEDKKEEKKSSKAQPALDAKEEKKSSKAQPALDAKKDDKEEEPKKPLKKSGPSPSLEDSDPSASQSEIDVALLESAPSDAGPIDESDPDRRVIACQKCSKKYRIKKKQVGKRFGCRKCKAKVKVPKDLFDKPADKAGKGDKAGTSGKQKSPTAAAVKEFSLDEGSDDGEAPGGAGSPAAKGAAAAATKTAEAPEKKESATAPAAKKSGPAAALPKDTSIAALAKAAADKKAAPLGPKLTARQKLFGYVQALIFLGVFAGIVGGVAYWKYSEAQAREQQKIDLRESEWKMASAPYTEAIDAVTKGLERAKAAIAPGSTVVLDLALVRDLSTGASALEKAVLGFRPTDSQHVVQDPINIQRAQKLVDDTKPEAKLQELYLLRGRLLLTMGGEGNILEASRGFADIAAHDPKSDEALALFGQAELKRRNYAGAIDALKRSLALKNEPRTHALLGIALEAGDLCRDAVKEYEGLSEPLAPVFKARALILDGSYADALAALDSVKLDGESQAAVEVRRGEALEKKGDPEGAARAFDAAVAAGSQSGRAYVARGEFKLRAGRFEDAKGDFDAALKTSGGARAALGGGDARHAVLDEQEARTSYMQATTLPVVASSALLFKEFDAFDDVREPDPRAAAWQHAGDAARAAGNADEARRDYQQAIMTDPFDPEAQAASAQLDIDSKVTAAAEPHVIAMRALLASAREHDAKKPPELVRGSAAAKALLVEAAYWDAKGDLDKAEKTVDAALAADPIVTGAKAFAFKGSILDRKGDPERAAAEYQKALDIETGGTDTVSRFYADALAAFEGAKGGDDAAVAKVRTALGVVLTLSPRHAHALLLRGRLAIIEKKWEDAERGMNAAVEANKLYTDALVARGFLYMRDLPDSEKREGMGDQALQDFKDALALDPKRADIFLGTAMGLWAKNEAMPALENLGRAIKLDPQLGDAYLLRAKIFRSLNKDKEADADEKRAKGLSKK
jgi:tetratricopeptide (TPR) repeat protein